MKIIKNPDPEITKMLDEHFANSNNCPCSATLTNCMCDDFKKQDKGFCNCLRFLKTNNKGENNEKLD